MCASGAKLHRGKGEEAEAEAEEEEEEARSSANNSLSLSFSHSFSSPAFLAHLFLASRFSRSFVRSLTT